MIVILESRHLFTFPYPILADLPCVLLVLCSVLPSSRKSAPSDCIREVFLRFLHNYRKQFLYTVYALWFKYRIRSMVLIPGTEFFISIDMAYPLLSHWRMKIHCPSAAAATVWRLLWLLYINVVLYVVLTVCVL